MYEDEVKKIVLDFIYNEDYEERQIEKKVEKLIREKIENVKKVNVYLCPLKNKIKLRIHLKIKNVLDTTKHRYEFDEVIIINSKRRNRLKKILND